MPTFNLKITDEHGNPLNGVILTNGEYNTSPCPFGAYGCTSGDGSQWEGTSDATGTISSNVPYTCVGHWTGTLSASGYEDYPYDYTSGYVTGDFDQTVQMVATSISGGASQNDGSNAQAGNLQNQGTAAGQAAGAAGAAAASNISGFITNNWWIIAILLLVVGIVLYLIYRGKSLAPRTTNLNASAVGVG